MEFLMQPIRRTAVMEEVNHNELPMEPLLYPAVATGAEELPPMATVSVDGQVCAPDVAAAAEGVDEPQASEQSIGQTDPKTPWLDSQAVQQLIGVVQSFNADKPEVFQEWFASPVFQVLDCLAGPASKD